MQLPLLLRRPAFWLIVQPVMIALFLAATGGFTPRSEPDTASYLGVDFSSWKTAVTGQRTLPYPIFLRAAGRLAPAYAAVPYMQFLVQVLAIAALYAGLRRYGLAAAPALAAASSLLYSGFFLYYIAGLLPDAMALAAAVVAVACLAAVVGGGGVVAWTGLTLSLALAYQFRPAYLFLVPLAPVLGLGLWWLKPVAERSGAWLRLGVGLSLASTVPLFLFCGLLWATVGHFGLVSYGGFNVLGIAGQLLTPELADELPADLQPLARAILEKQQQTPHWKSPAGYYDLYDNYDLEIWHIALPAARELYGDDEALRNRRLGELAKQILRARPRAYVRWLLPAGKHGVTQLFEYSFLDWPGLLLLCCLMLCQAALIARWRTGGHAIPATTDQLFLAYHATLGIALAFAAAKLSLVILVERPIHRYVAPASIFLLTWLAVAVVDRVQRLTRPRS